MEDYQHYITTSKYARWREEDSRRETWGETVSRYCTFFQNRLDYAASDAIFDNVLAEYGIRNWGDLYGAIADLEVMPSMRCLMTAGKALDRDNVAGYNCAYAAVDSIRVFDEAMYILMCGTGFGFSVERQYINKLPTVAEEFHETETTVTVADSKIGWCAAYREIISLLYGGRVPKWNLSKVRPSGTRLKTFGGRASGPGPLERLFKFTVATIKKAKGRKLNSLECHDIMCMIADIVIVGGVRRSALISLSNLTDNRMRDAKGEGWYYISPEGELKSDNPQRALANNSICYTELPDIGTFMGEWLALYESKSGERGIFNREASNKQVEKIGRREQGHDWGCNPCSEIILRPKQFCNLSEVIIRADDTLESLTRKVAIATFFGTIQSTLTDLRYLSKKWKDNTEEERLLGVSFTGIMDNELTSNPAAELLNSLRDTAIATNKKLSKILGICGSKAITCVKPSGTVSQLCNTASGIHPRHAKYYIRTVRQSVSDPLTQFLIDQGVPNERSKTDPEHTVVFSFPQKAPAGSIDRHDVSAIDQLVLWKEYQDHWCEHKPSMTCYVGEDEWLDVGAWVYAHFDSISGISFLPKVEHIYEQAPYQDMTEEEYNKMLQSMPDIDWTKLAEYEKEDCTTATHELACAAGGCEI